MWVRKDAEKDVKMQGNEICIPGLKPWQVCTNMFHVVGMISLGEVTVSLLSTVWTGLQQSH